MDARLCATPCAWGIWFPDDPTQVPWTHYLEQIAELGFTRTELGPPGYLPGDGARVRAELDARSLSAVGAFVAGPLHDPEALPALRASALQMAELVHAVGGRHVVLFGDSYRGDWLSTDSALVRPRRLADAGWRALVTAVATIAELVAERFDDELRVCFHPHADSNVEEPEDLERLLDETDAATVRVCMDTGHYAYRGGDPVAFMRRHGDRVPYMHVKGVDPAVLARVQEADWPLFTAVQRGVFTEPAVGGVDFPALAAVLREIDWSGDVGVEQDLYPCDVGDARPIVSRTVAFLESLGFAR